MQGAPSSSLRVKGQSDFLFAVVSEPVAGSTKGKLNGLKEWPYHTPGD